MIVYGNVLDPNHASYYYRVRVPIETMEQLGLDVKGILDEPRVRLEPEERARAIMYSDLCLMFQPMGGQLLEHMKHVHSLGPGRYKGTGEWRWPPTFVVDTDDNVFDPNPFNLAFKHMGTRYEGEEIPIGGEVGYEDSAGNQRTLWKDGVKGFDVQTNRERVAAWRSVLAEADAVTCTTHRAAERVLAEVPEIRRLFVFPNCVRLQDYPDLSGVRIQKEDPNQVRILWQGGSSHYEDLAPLREPMGLLARKYPQVRWIFWGFLFPWIYASMPTRSFEFVPWLSHEAYRQRLFTIGHDISIAPLTPHAFNQCRSAIKFYEASICPNPAATLAQRTGPYLDEIVEGETGLLFNDPIEFTEKMSLLIENELERKRLAQNAKDWVMEHRDAHKVVPKLYEFYRELRETRKRETPPPTEVDYKQFLGRLKEEGEDAFLELEPAIEGA